MKPRWDLGCSDDHGKKIVVHEWRTVAVEKKPLFHEHLIS